MLRDKEWFGIHLTLCGDALPVDEIADRLSMTVHSIARRKEDPVEAARIERFSFIDAPAPCYKNNTNRCILEITPRTPEAHKISFQDQLEAFLPQLEERQEALQRLLTLSEVAGYFVLEYGCQYAGVGIAYLSPNLLRRISNLGLGILSTLRGLADPVDSDNEDEEETLFPCPTCGFRAFKEGPGSFSVCPVCEWEDDPVQLRYPGMAGGANVLSLWQEQQRILKQYPVSSHEIKVIIHGKQYVRDRYWRPLNFEEANTEGAPQTSREYFDALRINTTRYYWLQDEPDDDGPLYNLWRS